MKAYKILDQSDKMKAYWVIASNVINAKSIVVKSSRGKWSSLIVYDLYGNHIPFDKKRSIYG